MNWSDLLQLEPCLIRADRLAADAFADGLDWPNFWQHVQPELVRLVGASASQPVLRSTLAYTVALEHCQTVWKHGDGSDSWRSARPWNGSPTAWHEDAGVAENMLPLAETVLG